MTHIHFISETKSIYSMNPTVLVRILICTIKNFKYM